MGSLKLLKWQLNQVSKHVAFEYIWCRMTITAFGPQYVKSQRTDNHMTDGSCIGRLLTYHAWQTRIYQVYLTSQPRRCNPQHDHWHSATIVNGFKNDYTHMHSLTDNQLPSQYWQIVPYYIWTYIFLLKRFCITCDLSISLLRVQETIALAYAKKLGCNINTMRLGGACTFPLPGMS